MCRLISRAGEGVDPFALVLGNLGNDMRRRAEAINSQALDIFSSQAVSAITDQARTEKRGNFDIFIILREVKTITLVGDSIFRISAIEGIPGEFGIIA